MNHILLISEDFVKTNSNLNDNVWGKNLLPAIREAQDLSLRTIIGEGLFWSIIHMVDNGTISSQSNAYYKEMLDDYIQPYLLYRVIADLIPIIGTKLSNIGTVVSNDEHITNLNEAERDRVSHYYEERADFYCRRLQEYLLQWKDKFVELDECACRTIKANLDSASSTGLWLGGHRGRIIKK